MPALNSYIVLLSVCELKMIAEQAFFVHFGIFLRALSANLLFALTVTIRSDGSV